MLMCAYRLFGIAILVSRYQAPLRSLINSYDSGGRAIVRLYEGILQTVIRLPLVALLIFIAIAAASVVIAPKMTLRLMPETTNQRFVMDLQLSRGTDVPQSDAGRALFSMNCRDRSTTERSRHRWRRCPF